MLSLGLGSDAEGLLPSALEARMLKEGPKPRVVYIIPTGQNPAGSTMGNRRREEVAQCSLEWHLFTFPCADLRAVPEVQSPAD